MRKRRSLHAMLVVAALAGAASTPSALVSTAAADGAKAPYDDATKAALQSVIKGQLEAIGHDDGTAAASFAADGIKQKFKDAASFMAMVKDHYGALVRPKSTTFGAVEPSPHGPLQTMTIVAADGTVWTAIYSFEQVGGTWRITGCGLEKDDGQQDI